MNSHLWIEQRKKNINDIFGWKVYETKAPALKQEDSIFIFYWEQSLGAIPLIAKIANANSFRSSMKGRMEIYINGKGLTKDDFNPNVVVNETF